MPVRREKLLICEGAEDMALIEAMMRSDLIPKDFRLTYIGKPQSERTLLDNEADEIDPEDDVETGYGIGGLKRYLESISAARLMSGINRVGFLVDNDMDAAAGGPTLNYVQKAIRDANTNPDVKKKFSIPTAAGVKATDKDITTCLMLNPSAGEAGCLESILIKILKDKYPDQMLHVEDFLNQELIARPVPAYGSSKRDKALVRIALTILNRSKPQMPLRNVFQHREEIMPVTHDLLKPLINQISAI